MMRCDDARALISRSVAGSLSDADRSALAAHTTSCDECRLDRDAAERIRAALSMLPAGVEPPRDLWPDIHRRLDRRTAAWHPSARPALLAAAVALLAVSGSITVRLLQRPHAQRSAPAAVTRPPASEEVEFVAGAAALSEALASREATLAPRTVAILRRNVAVIDEAIRESREALAQDPSNAVLTALLRATHRQKLDLLQRAVALPSRT